MKGPGTVVAPGGASVVVGATDVAEAFTDELSLPWLKNQIRKPTARASTAMPPQIVTVRLRFWRTCWRCNSSNRICRLAFWRSRFSVPTGR